MTAGIVCEINKNTALEFAPLKKHYKPTIETYTLPLIKEVEDANMSIFQRAVLKCIADNTWQ